MNRIDRLSAILIQLQSKKLIKAQEIAERFDISLRTVYRDIRALEEAGVPIAAEAGKGYSLMEGYRLPPIMFNPDEATSLLMGGKLIEKFSDESLKENFDNALLKIKAVLRYGDKERLDNLDQQIEIIQFPESIPHKLSNHFLTQVQRAIAEKRVLSLEYFANYSEEITHRKAEPIGIYYREGNWHLVAYCRLRQDYRDFRLDRVRRLHIEPETFDLRDDIPLKEHVQRFLQAFRQEEIIIHLRKEILPFIINVRHYYGFLEEKEVDEAKVEMSFLASDIDSFARWMLMFGSGAEVIYPEILRKRIEQLVQDLAKHYLKN